MPTSQFTIFTSSDVGGPGLLTGQAGTLLALLDACLVNGYAGHATSPKWTKPVANSGNIGSYKQGAGAGLGLVINDNGPNVTSTYKEAWATGWESVAGVGAPVGTGSGQFPTPAQLLTSGHVVIRKSNTADASGRAWQLFADSSTLYLFLFNGDTAGYSLFMFGDVFSLKGSSDAYRCAICGRTTENYASTGPTIDNCDYVYNLSYSLSNGPGLFMARSWGGGGTSINIQKVGDMSFCNAPSSSGAVMAGTLQTPNGPDNSLHIAPLRVVEYASAAIRGRFRGLYHVGHPVASFANSQTLSGGGDYAGKTFQIVAPGLSGGFWAVEISNTVETN